jgi:outer membrane protein assembly factor BamB
MKQSWLRNLLVVASLASPVSWVYAEDWTRFRGSDGSGVSQSNDVPTTWNQEKNVRWSAEMPGPGSSCPIVIGNQVLLTCYTGYGVKAESPGNARDLVRHLVSVDRTTGKIQWTTPIPSTTDEDPYTGFIVEHGFASSTPASDGTMIYVACGKTGLVAFDMGGKEVWRADCGKYSDPAKWGDGSSPLIYKDLVIINAGITGHAMMAFNKKTGKEAWRVNDEKLTNSWATPIVVSVAGRDEMVCASPGKIFAMDPVNGKELWRCDSPLKETVCASVIENDGVVFLMGGRQGSAIAVRCGGSGDVSKTHVVWEKPLRSGIGTPVVANGRLYWSSSGLALCADCKTGEEIFKTRLNQTTQSSQAGGRPPANYPSALNIGNKIYVTLRNGETQVWNASDTYEVVASNSFVNDEGPFNATGAVSQGQLFIRSNKMLYCIGG